MSLVNFAVRSVFDLWDVFGTSSFKPLPSLIQFFAMRFAADGNYTAVVVCSSPPVSCEAGFTFQRRSGGCGEGPFAPGLQFGK